MVGMNLRGLEEGGGDGAGGELIEEVMEEDEGGGGVEECFVPADSEVEIPNAGFEVEGLAEVAEAVGGQVGIGGAAPAQGINPRAETVAGECAEEAFFRACTVCDNPASAQ